MGSDRPPEEDPTARYRAEADAAEQRIPIEQAEPTRLWVLLSGWLDTVERRLRARGGRGLRFGIGAFWAVVGVVGVVLLVGPVIDPPQTFEDVTASARTATDHWIARDFDVDYRIDRTPEGRLVAHVTERIDALFPAGVDEHGIERVLATDYEGHSLAPTGISASLDGKAIAIARSASPTRLALTMDAGARLHGDHDFVLRYDLHDLAYETTDEATGRQVDLLRWDVFGPSWPQAFAALEVRVTLPEAVGDRLLRTPRGSLAWLVIGGGEWLHPDADAPAGRVSYSFDSKQNIPPHANAAFTFVLAPGTFTMPPHPALFWVQTFGPVAPLLLLAASLLLALAARAVAWSDDRGRPWFVAQYEPPKGVSPRMAAQVMAARRTFELADALRLAHEARGSGRPEVLRFVARVAKRAGRLGDRPRALAAYLLAKEHGDVVRAKLRRVPSGFVRDTFIGGPIALSALQLGLVRQLSHQARLGTVWWPVAFVAASWVLAVVVLAIALSARPLTRRGALVRQHLLGVGLFAQQTSLLSRGPVRDPLLPYAVSVLPARGAGTEVVHLVGAELGETDPARGWRVPGFLTTPRLLIRLLAPLSLVAVIVLVAMTPSPTEHEPDPVTYSYDLPGTYLTDVTAVRAAATLSKDAGGAARLAVVEHLAATFDDSTSTVPQLAQQWPRTIDGQDLGLVVRSISIDGTPASFTTEHDHGTTVARTLLGHVYSGSHDVAVAYSLASAAVAGSGGADRVRWAALLHGWDGGWASTKGTVPLTVSIAMPAALAADADGGWIDGYQQRTTPFGSAAKVADDRPGVAEQRTTAGGAVVRTLALTRDSDGFYPGGFTSGDLGVDLRFPAGTFTGPSASAATAQRVLAAVPFGLLYLVGGLAVLIALLGIVLGLQRRSRLFGPGLPRDLVRVAGPFLAIDAAILAVWTTIGLAGDEAIFPPLISTGAAAILLTIASWVLTRMRRASRGHGRMEA